MEVLNILGHRLIATLISCGENITRQLRRQRRVPLEKSTGARHLQSFMLHLQVIDPAIDDFELRHRTGASLSQMQNKLDALFFGLLVQTVELQL